VDVVGNTKVEAVGQLQNNSTWEVVFRDESAKNLLVGRDIAVKGKKAAVVELQRRVYRMRILRVPTCIPNHWNQCRLKVAGGPGPHFGWGPPPRATFSNNLPSLPVPLLSLTRSHPPFFSLLFPPISLPGLPPFPFPSLLFSPRPEPPLPPVTGVVWQSLGRAVQRLPAAALQRPHERRVLRVGQGREVFVQVHFQGSRPRRRCHGRFSVFTFVEWQITA